MKHTLTHRIASLEATVGRHLDEASVALTLLEKTAKAHDEYHAKMMNTVKKWGMWILWGLVVPTLQALGVDFAAIIERMNGGGGP